MNQRSASSRKRPHEESISFVKKSSPGGVKILKIEIYDPNVEPQLRTKVCECKAEKCVQYAVRSIIMDDIYRKVQDIIAEVTDDIRMN